MTKPRIGLIALNRDVVVEDDMHNLLASEAGLATTRIPLERIGSIGALRALESHLAIAAALLPVGPGDVVAVGCTSAVTVIGSDKIERRVLEGRPGAIVVNPLDGIRRGLRAVGANRIALVTPYTAVISRRIVRWLEEHGITVGHEIEVGGHDSDYADIPVHRITEAAAEVGGDVEAVVIPCTDLRAVSVIEEIETAIGVPAITSNQALAWSISKALDVPTTGPGRLFGSQG